MSYSVTNMNEDLRRYPRAEVKKRTAHYKVPNGMDISLASIKNISGGGVCLLAKNEIKKGQKVQLEFTLPSDPTSIIAEAEIVWTEPLVPATPEHSYKIGMKFLKIDERKKESITNFVVRYLQGKIQKEIAPSLAGKRKISILVIDDDKVTRQVVKDVFSQEFEVFTAEDGHAGVEIARDKCPDLILLDIIMPEIDGFSTLMLLRDFSETRDIPVIIISVIREKAKIYQAMKSGASGYLLKPFTTEDLLEKIRKIIY